MQRFNEIMQEAMNAQGLRAADLCAKTQIPKSTISFYLNGKTTPKWARMRTICEALNLDAETVKKGISDRVRSSSLSHSRPYRIWHGMKQRCSDPKHNSFKYYGGRGIKVCDEWLASYVNFYEWALTHGYTDELTIDRINVDGDYRPENCRWVTYKEQAQNKRPTT